jgi:hypothetical protein
VGMEIKVSTGFMARKIIAGKDYGFTPVPIGTYPIRFINEQQMEITKPDMTIAYLTVEKLENKVLANEIIVLNIPK